jgi:lipopolysaccharide heptosyltransferase II
MNPQRILIIQLKRAGDVLLTTPVVVALKKRFPDAKIDMAVDSAFRDVVMGLPALHRVILCDSRRPWKALWQVFNGSYDCVFDFQRSPRSAMLTLVSGASTRVGYAMPFWGAVYSQRSSRPGDGVSVVGGKLALVESLTGPLSASLEPVMTLSASEQAWAQTAMPPVTGAAPIVGIIPTHRHDIRRWPADRFAAVAREWLAVNAVVWVFWGPGEETVAQDVARLAPGAQLIPHANLRQMASLLARCRVVVTNDSGPMHIAAAVGAPTVTIYGPTSPVAWNPGGSRHRAIRLDQLPCIGCNRLQCPYNHECMNDLASEHALKASVELMNAGKKR